MTDDPKPTQQTPQGHEIPVPKKADVLRDFAKVAKPVEQDNSNDDRKDKAS